MGPTLGDVLVRVAVDMAQLQAGLAQAEARLRSFAATASTAGATASRSFSQSMMSIGTKMNTLGTKMAAVGRSMTRYITLPIVGIGAAATKMAVDFEYGLAKIEALSGSVGMSTKKLTAELKSLSSETGVGMRDLGEALYFIASAGLEASDVMPVLEQTARGVAVEMGDAATIGQLLTSILYDYGKSGMTAARAMDILAAAIKEGKSEPAELAANLGSVLPQASQAGVALEDIVTVIAAMTNAGDSTARAVTGLRFALASLINPSTEAKNVLKDFDIPLNWMFRTLQQPGGLIEVLRTLADTFDLSTRKGQEAFATMVGGARGLKVAAVVTGESADKIDASMRRIYNSAGLFDKAVKKMEQTSRHKLRVLWAEMEAALIELGNEILPILVDDVIPALQSAVKWFSDLSPATKEWAVKLGILAAALGPVVRLVGLLLKGGGKAITLLAGLSAASAGAAAGTAAGAGAAGAATGGVLGVLKAHPVGALVALTAAVTAWGIAQDKADREARESLETLAKVEMRATGVGYAALYAADGTEVFAGQTREVADELERMAHKAEVAIRFGENLGQQWLGFFDTLTGVSRENKQIFSELVGTIIELQGSFGGLTAFQVQNLLKVGDLDAAYALLMERLNAIAGPLAEAASQFSSAANAEQEVTEKAQKTALGLQQVGSQADTTRGRVRSYKEQLDQLPDKKHTTITADTTDAMRNIDSVQRALDSLERYVTIHINVVGDANPQGGGHPHHSGGRIYHRGGLAADEVPAILQRGEYVINKRSASRLGLPLLDSLNRYHTGGIGGGRGPTGPAGAPYVCVAGIVDVRIIPESIKALADAIADAVGAAGGAGDLAGAGLGGGGGGGLGGWGNPLTRRDRFTMIQRIGFEGVAGGYGLTPRRFLKYAGQGWDSWKILKHSVEVLMEGSKSDVKLGKALKKAMKDGKISKKEMRSSMKALLASGAFQYKRPKSQGGGWETVETLKEYRKYRKRRQRRRERWQERQEDKETGQPAPSAAYRKAIALERWRKGAAAALIGPTGQVQASGRALVIIHRGDNYGIADFAAMVNAALRKLGQIHGRL